MKDAVVTSTVLAEQMGWSRFRALRELRRIEAAHPGVVRRKGRVLYGLASRLAAHIEGLRPSVLEREVGRLSGRVRELEDRVEAEARARIAFQHQARQWFERGRGR